MFCDKKNINLLTAYLIEYGIKNVVVCPGSRNAPIIHNLHNHSYFKLYPVTDERSAAFVAIGISIATQSPCAVCVTSGTALLNTLSAVAEAYYRHTPLLIISADRPPERIGQLDGQTLIQNKALEPYAYSTQLCEPTDAAEEKECIFQIEKALIALTENGRQPVHINIPISEPLFQFVSPSLPKVSVHQKTPIENNDTTELDDTDIDTIKKAQLPVLIMGQFDFQELPYEELDRNQQLLVLPEIVANTSLSWRTTLWEELFNKLNLQPDVVIHIGGNMVNKQLKLQLQASMQCKVIRIEPGKDSPDTFKHLEKVIRNKELPILKKLQEILPSNKNVASAQRVLDRLKEQLVEKNGYKLTKFSDLGIMQMISQNLLKLEDEYALHLANSSSIRNATYFFTSKEQKIYCNRGVNGIEGSLSTAVGYSLAYKGKVFIFIGDLSFFYDNNALWNNMLTENLRIILFNNGGGQIFKRLKGLDSSPALDHYIAANHTYTAKGIAESYNIEYYSAQSYNELSNHLPRLTKNNNLRPILLEVFTNQTDNEIDLKNIHTFYQQLIIE